MKFKTKYEFDSKVIAIDQVVEDYCDGNDYDRGHIESIDYSVKRITSLLSHLISELDEQRQEKLANKMGYIKHE